jgi:hypothetical protein
VQHMLRHWQTDPDLAGLREAATLAKLPEAERKRCRQFWAEVTQLLDRAGKEPVSEAKPSSGR